jgi:hypothetical protein
VSDEVIQIAERSLASVFGAPCLDDSAIRLNKATAHSWLLYAARTFASDNKASDFNSYLEWFERTRGQQRELARRDPEDRSALAVSVFNDRATARVNDVSSVLLRDAVLWALAAKQGDATATGPRSLLAAFAEADGPATAESRVLETITRLRWAQLR